MKITEELQDRIEYPRRKNRMKEMLNQNGPN